MTEKLLTGMHQHKPRCCTLKVYLIFKYLTVQKVQMHAGTIRKLLYGLCFYTGD